jgi:2-keto-4-pentenoate hydratase/2-oxohepta-3-ene-1,7-dioic acid hydratase in catechol pathway
MVFAKCFETHTPLGPWIVTADEAGDPHALALETWVNGERRQAGSTADMVGDCFELISELSHFCTLNPGDVILTGTPDGCGVFHKPAAMLRPGDLVRSVIEGLGEMENRMMAEPAAAASASAPSPVLATGSDGRR